VSKESHVGIAQSQRAPSHDSLALTLEETRRNVHASTLPRRRALWRYCTIAYRDWLGIQLVEDAPIIKVEPLTKLELVELLQLADEVPTVVRDLLRLRKEARISQRKITLRKQEWAAPRVAMLVELHQLALFAAGAEYAKAQKAYEKALKDTRRGNYEASCLHRAKMITACERQIATLQAQLHALTARS